MLWMIRFSLTPETELKFKKGLRVLLAEDNVVNQKIASFNLKQLDYEVVIASNGKISRRIFQNRNVRSNINGYSNACL